MGELAAKSLDAVAPAAKPSLAPPRRLLKLRSDAALAERFASGDEAAFDVLYERNRASVLAVCMGVLGTAHDAEDATQETFAALAVALRNVPPRELRPWLIRVARNAAIDVARRRRRGLTADGEMPDVAARQSSGAAELQTVLAGIRELPESQRTALLMRELGGHSYLEIGALLEIDEEAVRGLIARARVGLRTYREATEMSCASARQSIEAEPDGRRHDKTVRRHLRGCASCKAYRAALRDDARALRAVMPLQLTGLVGGGAFAGSFAAAKGALVGASVAQVTACAASVCAVGGFVAFGPLPHGIPLISGPAVHASAAHHAISGHETASTVARNAIVVGHAQSGSGAGSAPGARTTASHVAPGGSESAASTASTTTGGGRIRRLRGVRTTSLFSSPASGQSSSSYSGAQSIGGGSGTSTTLPSGAGSADGSGATHVSGPSGAGSAYGYGYGSGVGRPTGYGNPYGYGSSSGSSGAVGSGAAPGTPTSSGASGTSGTSGSAGSSAPAGSGTGATGTTGSGDSFWQRYWATRGDSDGAGGYSGSTAGVGHRGIYGIASGSGGPGSASGATGSGASSAGVSGTGSSAAGPGPAGTPGS